MIKNEGKCEQEMVHSLLHQMPLSQKYNHIAGEHFQHMALQQAQIELAEEQRQQNRILLELVNKQQEANNIQKQSNVLMQQQIEFLQETNKAQEKALKREKVWSIIAWVITTLIALASVVSDFLNV